MDDMGAHVAVWVLTSTSHLLPAETSSSNILYRRTRRLRKLTGIESLRCQPEIMSEHMTGKEVGSLSHEKSS